MLVLSSTVEIEARLDHFRRVDLLGGFIHLLVLQEQYMRWMVLMQTWLSLATKDDLRRWTL